VKKIGILGSRPTNRYCSWLYFPSTGTDSWICSSLFSVREFAGYGCG